MFCLVVSTGERTIFVVSCVCCAVCAKVAHPFTSHVSVEDKETLVPCYAVLYLQLCEATAAPVTPPTKYCIFFLFRYIVGIRTTNYTVRCIQ